MTPSSTNAQTRFRQKFQYIVSQGECQATYKYGLLLIFAKLAVEAGQDTGEALERM